MADLTVNIKSETSQASKAFKDLAQSSEELRGKIEKMSQKFGDNEAQKFIDQQKLVEISLKGTRGEVDAMTAAQNNYQHKIESLIRSGLDPESDAVKKLRDEQEKLKGKIDKAAEAQKAQEKVMKTAEKAALGMVAAIGASVVALGAATQKTAEAGDKYAKTARIIGMTAETFQELDYAAKMSGIDNLKGSLEKLNKSVADVKDGTGTLTTYLKNNDEQLLAQLESVSSNEEAFNLLMDAIGKAPDEFSRAELAQAAFGKSGQELILLAHEGADGIAALREEARKYGVISNEAAANSEAYLDAQARLKASLAGVANELTAGLMPGLTGTITKLADFIAGIDNWEDILKNAGIALAGATASLVTFIAVSKGHTMVTAMSGAIKTLSLALTAGPAGAIAAVVGGLAIAIGVFTTASNNAAHAGERWAEKMESTSGKAESLLTDWQRLNGEKALDEQTSTRLLALYPGLAEKMDVNTASAQELLAAIKELNRENAASAAKEWIDKLQKQQEELKKAEEALDKYTVKAKENIEISISMGDAAKAKEFEEALEVYADVVDKTRKKIANSIDQANAILATVGQQLGENNTIIDIPITVTPDEDEAKKAAEAAAKAAAEAAAAEADKLNKTLKQKLADMSLTTEQQLNEQLNAVTAFLAQRAELELTDSEERILAKEEELARIKEFDDLSNEEKYLAETELLTQLADLRRTAGEERITAYQEELARIQENEDLSNEEKTIAEKAANQAIINLHKQMATEDDKILKDKFKKYQEYKKKEEEAADAAAAKEQELLEERLGALSTFFSSIGSLLEDSSKHNRGFAIAARAMAAAEAAINSYLAFTKALASAPPPANYVLAAAALTAGIAQQIKIISTPIPSAETGGRFVVPTAVGSDSRLMRVNPGEEIDVTPRGMAGFNNAQTITVQIEKQVIFDVVNDGIRSNDILIEAVNY